MYNDGASYVQFKYTNGYAHRAIHVQETTWRVPQDTKVAAGSLCAASDGRRGTFGAGTSTGAHVHFQGHRPDGTRIPWQDVPDPNVQLAGSTPRIISEPSLEEEDMLALRIAYGDRTHHVALGIGTFRHIAGTDPDKIKNVLRVQDDWQDIGLSELGQFLRTFGCDERIWDLRDTAGNPTSAGDARFCVLDPLTGSVSEGNVWTAVNALRAQVKGIEQPTIDVSPLIAAARQAVIEGLEGLTFKATKG
jgi:hypothetical protein